MGNESQRMGNESQRMGNERQRISNKSVSAPVRRTDGNSSRSRSISGSGKASFAGLSAAAAAADIPDSSRSRGETRREEQKSRELRAEGRRESTEQRGKSARGRAAFQIAGETGGVFSEQTDRLTLRSYPAIQRVSRPPSAAPHAKGISLR